MKYLLILIIAHCCCFGEQIAQAYYTLTAKSSGYALTIFAKNKTNKGPICQDKNSKVITQQWLISPVQEEPGYYTLTSKFSGYRLEVFAGNRIDGGPLCHAKPDNSDLQKWLIQPSEYKGYYTLTSKFSGHCLDVFYANKKRYGAVCHAQPRENDAQKWLLQLCGSKISTTYSQIIHSPKNSNLIWQDEFDGTKLDLGKWSYRGLGKRKGGMNVVEAVKLNGKGQLIITTSKNGTNYYTGMISTHKKFEHRFGYYECRVKFQTQQGHWPTFWLMSPKISMYTDNPHKSGVEVDIFEYLTTNGGQLLQGIHWNGYGKHHKREGRPRHPKIPISTGWHTVGVEWTKEHYIFYVDGKETWRTKTAVSHIHQYIILSTEVAEWTGDITKAVLPDHVYFDYVRVYKTREK
ncbi:family 16 glycosylhydrolase [Candidatus Uabimicrobium sp. HlEnr_7]|uniref:family 16 glycosylhydrolase n=1 Tax=Candidatus Uabimicrobium helgolandensis TaxID=3095367 RepID=UPI003555C69D